MEKIPEHAQKVFEGVVFDVYQWKQEMFDGSHRTFEMLKRRRSAVVFCVFDDKTILINHEEQPGKASFISLPGGGADTYDELPLSVIQRELEEETGYTANMWKEVFVENNFPKLDWAIHYFVARDLQKIHEPRPMPSEKIESHRVTLDEFLNLHREPLFRDKGMKYMMLRAQTDSVYRQEIENILFK